MAGNPLIDQGTLNRLVAAIVVPNATELNVTPSFLGPEGIGLNLEGEAGLTLPTLTGTVTSPQPFQLTTVTVNLLRTQPLAAVYKARMESDTRIGPFDVIPDLPPGEGIGRYQILNGQITSVRELRFAGQDPGWIVTLRGYYLVNSALWP
jgi:hypothetical protein